MDLALERRRLLIRRRALGNLVLILRGEAARTGGRCTVEGVEDGVILRYAGVQTLVRDGAGYAIACRDFTVRLVVPTLWPFDREAALAPMVMSPHDFRHPNSDSRLFCLDTRGIAPERLIELVYDNLRLRNRNLGHSVDHAVADFVRSRFPGDPADPRSLFADDPGPGPEGAS